MVSEERIKTNHMLMDELGMWDEFTIKAINDEWTLRYYNHIMNLLNNQVDESIKWLESEDARQLFYDEAKYQYGLFQSLEDEWDEILENKYPSIEALLQEVYNRGKAKGYAEMREHIKFSDTDKLALEFVREYNFALIRKLDNDTRDHIRNIITSAVVGGENPRSVAPKIMDTVGTRLIGSTFTPAQRAVMIVRTEISRTQNTGILQSYVNEGYTEVKILTAEDDNVCYTCLSYAYEFNEEEGVIFANHGKEKVHNINELIKGEMFPPFHPNCRCTYLSIWSSKGEPPKNPYQINLTPMRFLDYENKIVLPDGKPKIKLTENQIRDTLKNFVDTKKELNAMTSFIMEYMVNLDNRNKESLSAMDLNFNLVCDQYTNKESGGVSLCPKGKKASKKGLLFVIHNHPSNNPLQSYGDLMNFADYNVKYNIVFTEENGLFILKNNGADKSDIQRAWDNIFDEMKDHFKTNNSKSYNEEYDNYVLGVLSRKDLKKNIWSKVIKHMGNNINKSKEVYESCMVEVNVEVLSV